MGERRPILLFSPEKSKLFSTMISFAICRLTSEQLLMADFPFVAKKAARFLIFPLIVHRPTPLSFCLVLIFDNHRFLLFSFFGLLHFVFLMTWWVFAKVFLVFGMVFLYNLLTSINGYIATRILDQMLSKMLVPLHVELVANLNIAGQETSLEREHRQMGVK